MYILHAAPDSASTIVALVLAELGQPFENRLIDRAGGALCSPAYLAMQPMGKIPALETPEGTLFETAAILLYLAEKHGRMAPAPGTPARGQFLKWYFFTSTNIHPTLLQIYYPHRTAGPQNADAVRATALETMGPLLSTLNAMVAAEAPVWLSREPSIFGYYLGVLMRWLAEFFPAANYPALLPVLKAHESTAAAQTIAQAENLGPTLFTNPAS